MTPIADMVEQMFDLDCGVEAILVAIRGVELSRFVPGTVPGDMGDTRRERERLKKRRQRGKAKQVNGVPEANDAGRTSPDGAYVPLSVPGTEGDNRCLLTSSSFLGASKESKEEVVARARGSRLSPDMTLPDDWRAFAAEHGADADAAFAEFKDYWIAVPGQRGTKLNWFATWRNRIRELPNRRKPNGKATKPSAIMAALAEHRERFAADENRSGGDGEPPPRLLSHG